MNLIKLDKKNHSYRLNGNKYPATTKIIGSCFNLYENISPETLELYAERGKSVHKLIEFHNRGILNESKIEILKPFLDAYKSFENDIKPEVLYTELSLYSVKFGYAGTIDIVAKINGKVSIIDIKTCSTVSELVAGLQLSAYSNLYNEYANPQASVDIVRYVLQLLDTSKYKLTPLRNKNDFCDFLACFRLYNRKKQFKKE